MKPESHKSAKVQAPVAGYACWRRPKTEPLWLQFGSAPTAVPTREAVAGLYSLMPHWATDLSISRHTYNARTETVAEKPNFRDAWRHGQH
ncbi:SOS response-associated peptidase family protein [Hydrogenophaga sp.]|uniref:SOS response-associated peptidase family protein n=1 Tax=Hydrogenophaga sp. TaxID=1904254 RepID=UPI00391A510A